jgi:Cdc6-like AAA superfamily ATPase
METMAEWFGLAEGRRNFWIENDADAKVFFARANIDEKIQALLRTSFRTSYPPKFVLYGDWGVGKTHTMRHVEYVINTNDAYRALCVFVELPDITAKTNFQEAHAALMDAIGLDRVKTWMVQFQTKYQSKVKDIIQKETQSEDIFRAFSTLIGFGEAARIAWDWLRGTSLSSAEARTVGLPQQLSQSNHLVGVLRMAGRLSLDIDGRMLVLMIDEADKLRVVSNGDAVAHWKNALKLLSDKLTKETGLIIAGAFNDTQEMPEMLSDQQIITRFGAENYLLLSNFGTDETRTFLEALLETWTDAAKRMALQEKHVEQADGEEVTDKSFPFTVPGRDIFVDYVCRNGGITSPRDIQSGLESVLNAAIDQKRHLLSSMFLNSVFNG